MTPHCNPLFYSFVVSSFVCLQALDKVQSQVEDYFQATRQQVTFKLLDDVTPAPHPLDPPSPSLPSLPSTFLMPPVSRCDHEQVFKLDDVTSSQRAAVYSQRRAFLSSSDEGMLETFTKYCHTTMSEIVDAAFSTSASASPQSSSSSSQPSSQGTINGEKLRAKAIQFFPNIQVPTFVSVVAVAARLYH